MMPKKILLACMILVLGTVSAIGEEYNIAGLWNIHGSGFVEKGVVRISLTLNGNMTLSTASTAEILNNAVSRDLVDSNLLSGDLKFLTGYDGYLRVDATGLSISVWDDEIHNGIRIPAAIPARIPTNDSPYVLPVSVTENGLNYTVTLVSSQAGKLRVHGFTDFGELKDAELNADATVWKHGTPMPELDSETSSGCDSGNSGVFAVMMLVIFAGVKKFVRN